MKPYGLRTGFVRKKEVRKGLVCLCCFPTEGRSPSRRERQVAREEVAAGLSDDRACEKCMRCWESGKERGCCSYQSGPKSSWLCMSCDCFDAQEYHDMLECWHAKLGRAS